LGKAVTKYSCRVSPNSTAFRQNAIAARLVGLDSDRPDVTGGGASQVGRLQFV